MKIEVGKKYKNRIGNTVNITNSRFMGAEFKGIPDVLNSWYYIDGKNSLDESFDLIAEVLDPIEKLERFINESSN